MKKVIYTALLLICFRDSLISQHVYFNNRYHLYQKDIWSGITNVNTTNDGFIIAGATGDTSNYFWNRVGVMKLDAEGNVICRSSFGNSDALYYTGWAGSLIKSQTGSYYLTGTKQYYDSIEIITGYFFKFRSNCDSVFSKIIPLDEIKPVDTVQSFRSINTCSDYDLVFTGGVIINEDLPIKALLLKTDTSGNIKFKKFFGSSGLTEGYSIIQTPDKGFAIGGFWYIPGSSVYTGDPIVIKTDSLGNQEWKKNLGEQYMDNKALLCLSPEGDIIVGTVIADSMMGSDPISKIQITKMTASGNIVWEEKYGAAYQYNYLSRIICLNNGKIIAVGHFPDDYPHRVGWMINVDSNGDSLWYRTYEFLKGEESKNYFYDVALTSDNGFIVGGYIYPKPPDTGIQDSWVIKLDSMGCDTPGCNPGVWVPEDLLSENYLDVYPNPTTNRIFCQISLPVVSSEILIYDVYGRLRKVITIPERQSEISLDVSSFTNGLYLMVLKDHQKVLGSRKFIVRR